MNYLTAKQRQELEEIAKNYLNLQCVQCALAIKNYLKLAKIKGKLWLANFQFFGKIHLRQDLIVIEENF